MCVYRVGNQIYHNVFDNFPQIRSQVRPVLIWSRYRLRISQSPCSPYLLCTCSGNSPMGLDFASPVCEGAFVDRRSAEHDRSSQGEIDIWRAVGDVSMNAAQLLNVDAGWGWKIDSFGGKRQRQRRSARDVVDRRAREHKGRQARARGCLSLPDRQHVSHHVGNDTARPENVRTEVYCPARNFKIWNDRGKDFEDTPVDARVCCKKEVTTNTSLRALSTYS